MKNLETFIHMHRTEFDVYQPGPEVWAGISSGLTASALLSKLLKFFGSGSKNLVLTFAATSTMVASGIWIYQSTKSPKLEPAQVMQSSEIKETNMIPENPVVKAEVPISENARQMPGSIKKETPVEASEHKEPIEPVMQTQNPQPNDPILSTAPTVVTEPGDSLYGGIKTLALKSSGYNFTIKRSDSKMTKVRILKPGKVINKETNSELALKIEKKGSELVFEYEDENKRRWGNYQTINTGEIEILIPDGEISQISAISSHIDLSGYTTPSLHIETISGMIHASDVKAKLSVSSTSGKLSLTEITGDLDCNAISGKTSITNLQGNVHIETTSGGVELIHSRGDVTCESISGSIKLNDVQGKLDLHTNSGSIKGESVSLTERCDIQTISGSVDMNLQNNISELSFDLSSISGNLKINKGGSAVEGQKLLRIGTGKIPVTAKTTSGSQVYR